FEEPMNEHSMSSYVWLAKELRIPIVGPETAEGKMFTRAEWVQRGAADISRYSANVAGITAMMKAVHLCASFRIQIEGHGGGAAPLSGLGPLGVPGGITGRAPPPPARGVGGRPRGGGGGPRTGGMPGAAPTSQKSGAGGGRSPGLSLRGAGLGARPRVPPP